MRQPPRKDQSTKQVVIIIERRSGCDPETQFGLLSFVFSTERPVLGSDDEAFRLPSRSLLNPTQTTTSNKMTATQTTKQYDLLFKLIVVGESGVGKSSLILRYAENVFNPSFIPTIGVDFKFKDATRDGKHIKMQIWDTAGQQRFREITTSFFRGSHGAMVVYDCTDSHSFRSVPQWVAQVRQIAGEVPVLIVASKLDADKVAVPRSQGQEMAQELGCQFIECSSAQGVNITEAFETLISACYVSTSRRQQNLQQEAKIVLKNRSKKNSCCSIM